eukprot:8788790-Ditylum_brightwellii.AAC.1
MARFISHTHVIQQGLIVEPSKRDRLVLDGSIKLDYNSKPVNSMTHLKKEPEVTFGSIIPNHLIRTWNLRISYHDDDILLWDDDATGAFRQCKLHPGIAQVLSFMFQQLMFIPCDQTFGSNTKSSNWEPIRRVREIQARWLSTNKSLIEKHKYYTERV